MHRATQNYYECVGKSVDEKTRREKIVSTSDKYKVRAKKGFDEKGMIASWTMRRMPCYNLSEGLIYPHSQ